MSITNEQLNADIERCRDMIKWGYEGYDDLLLALLELKERRAQDNDKAAQSSQRSISAEVLNELLMLPERLLNKVNLVTAPYRHGNKILNSELDELCERQIEVEQALEKLREAIK